MTAQKTEPIENPGVYFNICLKNLIYDSTLDLDYYERLVQLHIATRRLELYLIAAEDGDIDFTELEI